MSEELSVHSSYRCIKAKMKQEFLLLSVLDASPYSNSFSGNYPLAHYLDLPPKRFLSPSPSV